MELITFDEIPYDRLEPGTFLEVRPNYRNVGLLPYPVRSLLVLHKLPAGNAKPGQVIQVTNANDGIALAGAGSIGSEQVASFVKANKTTPLYAIALGDAENSVKARGSFTFAGGVNTAVVLRVKINNKQVRFTVLSEDDPEAIANKMAAAVNAETLPVTASAENGIVTLDCRHGGEVGNDIDLRIDTKAQPIPDGLTITINAMANGSGNPDVNDALDAVAGQWFTQIQMPWNDITNVEALVEECNQRYKALSKLDVHSFVGFNGTFGEMTTFGDLTNSPFLTITGVHKTPTAPWVHSASSCGIAAFHLTNDPARQLRSLVVPDFEAPDDEYQFSEEEQDFLLRRGISTFDHLPDGSTTISRMITTYKVSNLGVADRAWMDIMVPATMSRIRYDWAAYVSLLYPRSKLVEDEETAAFLTRPSSGADPDDDDQAESNAVVTPRRMHASWAARCRLYADLVWVQNVDKTIRQSRFVIDKSDDNRLNANQQVKIAGNLMVLAGALEFQV